VNISCFVDRELFDEDIFTIKTIWIFNIRLDIGIVYLLPSRIDIVTMENSKSLNIVNHFNALQWPLCVAWRLLLTLTLPILVLAVL
jgi:hypothetical protein